MACEAVENWRRPPLVSVIIPSYNCERYLCEAIESVLRQTYPSLQIIVVDDGSTDSTPLLVRNYTDNVEYIRQPRSGSGSARNTGVAAARGDFLAFLDADDLWVEEKTEIQMGFLERHRDVEAVFTHARQFFSHDLPQDERERIWCTERPLPGHIPSTLVIRKAAFSRIGEFESRWTIGDFMSWYLRAEEQGLHTVVLPDCLCLRRLHRTNKGIVHSDKMDQRFRILKAALDRRRGKTV